MEAYEVMLNAITPKVSFGCTTIHVYRPAGLKSGQVGYSVTSTGQPLVGEKSGDWRRTWLVIGYDETSGDPLFIDKAETDFPVYTAIIGKGQWNPVRIAVSLAAFGEALSAIEGVAQGREYPTALEQNPLSESKRSAVLAEVGRLNPGVALEFWQKILDQS